MSGTWVMLTLDLPGASSEKRAKFNAALEEEKWGKFDAVDTVWLAKFIGEAADDYDVITEVTERDVTRALRIAKLTQCVAVISISGTVPHKPSYLPSYGPDPLASLFK